jgi:D-inositol-3-phosphate glycosyltransferase
MRTAELEKSVRVALIDPLGQHAGNHYYTDQLARGLTHAGAEVTVYAHDGDVDHSPDRPYEYLEPFHGIYGDRHPAFRGMKFLSCLGVTFADITRRRTDIVHVQMWAHDIREILQIFLARLIGKKVVVSAHEVKGWSSRRSSVGSSEANADSDEDNPSRQFRWVMAHTDAIVVHNRHSFDLLKSHYDPKVPIAVIPLPHVSHAESIGSLPDRDAARTRLDLPADKFIFLFFGNCRLEKGLDLALRAVAEVKESGDDVLFVTAGKMKPHEEAHFREIADELGLVDTLRMDVGLVPDDVAVDYFRAANAVVIPYRVVAESGVAITASTYGRALLASDLPPLLEATENGRLGLHFRTGDAHDLAGAMMRAVAMRDELDVMGDQAKEKVLQQRDPDGIGADMFELYRKVLA